MAALTKDRDPKQHVGELQAYPLNASTHAFGGGIAVLNGTGVEPGSTATGLVALGVFNTEVDNSSGAEGDKDAEIREGVFQFDNDATDPVTLAAVGSDVYIVDDQTVAVNDGTGTRSRAGKMLNLTDDDKVVVRIGAGLGE